MEQQRRLESDASGINEKIDFLRDMATALVREVRTLDTPKKIELFDDFDFNDEVKRFEISLINQALDKTGGNQHRAAKLLKLKYTTLHSKIKRYKLRRQNRNIASNAFGY